MNGDITDGVVNTAERIEEYDSPDEIEPLDVKLTVGLDGQVREVVLILTVDGPHIEVNVTNGTVSGSWGGDTHTTHVNNEPLCDHLHEHYAELYRMQN